MQGHVFFRDTWHHPYITSWFCGKRFYSPCFFAFSGVPAALWHVQPCTESKGRDCADNYCIYPLMLCIIFSCVYCYYYVNLGCWPWNGSYLPLLVIPEVFPPVVFSMQAHVFLRDTWHHLYLFLSKTFSLPLFFTCYGVQAALWQVQSCFCNNRLKVHRNKRRLWHAEHDSSASCMFYSMSRHSHEKISAQSSAVIRTGSCPTGY